MKIKNLIFNIIIGILSFVLLITLLVVAGNLMDASRSFTYDEDNFFYGIQGERYESIVGYMYKNEACGVKPSGDMEECYAVARYYEAASYYKAYEQAGDSSQAAQKRAIMKEEETRMGELSYVKNKIDAALKIDFEE